LVFEADGEAYPCDFYATDKWRLGNIADNKIKELISSNAAENFIEISRPIYDKCMKCKWANLCRGGCRRVRDTGGTGKLALNYYCTSYDEFFKYSIERLHRLAGIFTN
jgi:uncharacterized protein